MPMATNVGSPASSIPDIAMKTVTPEMSTAWPDVEAARSRADRRLAADARLASRRVPLADAMTAASPFFLARRRPVLAALMRLLSAVLVTARSSRSRRR